MYLELPIEVCKQNCLEFFNRVKHLAKLPFKCTAQQLQCLLDLTLNYSLICYKDKLYFQKKGIQMGNNASVSIANTTASLELEKLWQKEMIFRGRFIDDILSILDITDLQESVESYISRTFQHNFLKFTYEFSLSSVSFLDLNVELRDNKIVTSLYKKPMSRHEYLHYSSSHPKHILRSLPYSCGLRVIRSCSEETTKIKELNIMFEKFRKRNYPLSLLETIYEKLLLVERNNLMLPKSNLHIQTIPLHYPNLLPNFQSCSNQNDQINNQQSVYVILPYYQSIPNLKIKLNKCIIQSLMKCRSTALKKAVLDLNIQYAHTIPNQMHRIIGSIKQK
ncbi:unnamed protein product [Orchesella dallaii]|uniref:Helix-turn-helix domain-containing protein n=1 Tax=Orchesella dallaii TaxID=48710 RepID=A0ABP1RNP5_9HEXA